MKEAFFADINTTKAAPKPAKKVVDDKSGDSTAPAKAKPKLKLKKVDDDPFASDNDEEAQPKKIASPKGKRAKDSDDENGADERPKKRATKR